MRDRFERSARLGAERQPLDAARPVGEPVHLLAREHETHGTLQRLGAEHSEHDLILRPQAGAEAAAHIGRQHAHIVRLHVEDAAQILLHVLHALGLVVDRELAAAFPDRRRGEQFHRIVMLDRNEIFRRVPHRRGRKRLIGLATRLRRRLDRHRLVAFGKEVGREPLRLVFHAYQRGGKARDLPFLGQDESDRLPVEQDLVVIERPERRALLGRHIVFPRAGRARHRRPVFMRENVEHAFDAQRVARVNVRDAALGDRRCHDGGVDEAIDIVLAGILGGAGHLGMTVDAGGRSADVGRCAISHGAHRTFLDDCDCGVPRAACVSARTTARRARSILKALCA